MGRGQANAECGREEKRMPKVTVLMPVYNASKFLREAVDSILKQSFSDFEFLIIDDGPQGANKVVREQSCFIMVFNTPSACGGVTDQKRVQGLPWGLIPFIIQVE